MEKCCICGRDVTEELCDIDFELSPDGNRIILKEAESKSKDSDVVCSYNCLYIYFKRLLNLRG